MAHNENNDRYSHHLKELAGSDYEIVDGEPDIKGWTVENEQRQKIGEVTDMLFDEQARKVRYLVIDTENNDIDLAEKRNVLVPIGIAELQTGDSDVILRTVTKDQINALPAYTTGSLTGEMEQMIRRIFEGGAAAAAVTTAVAGHKEFYDHDHFDENKFYRKGASNKSVSIPIIEENLEIGKKDVVTGGAKLTSRIVERPVEKKINLKEEHIDIKRTPVDRPVSATDLNAFKEEEIEMTEHAEIPVVTKEAHVVEEISLNKDVQEKEETIKETVRSTEVITEKIDPKNNIL